MSTPNPLVPQGTEPNAPRVKSNIKIAVVTILAIHVFLFGGLLLQGCKPDKQQAAGEPTNALPAFNPETFAQQQQQPQPGAPQPGQPPAPPAETLPPAVPTPPANALAPQPVPVPAPQPGVVPVPPTEPAPATAAPAGEYIVKKGDYFEKIAKENGTTVKALTAANPGVDSRKLKIGQKLALPAPGAAATAAAPAPVEAAPAGVETYTVKSGDSLTKIASSHKTTVKALRAANNLKTDQIKVGQKLKIPVKVAAEPPPAVLPQPAPAPAPVPVPGVPAPQPNP